MRTCTRRCVTGHARVSKTRPAYMVQAAMTLTAAASSFAPQACHAFHGASIFSASPLHKCSNGELPTRVPPSNRRYLSTTTLSNSSSSSEQTENERKMTDDALKILTKAIQSVNPRTAIQNCLSKDDGEFIVTDPTSKRKISYKRDDYDEVVNVSFG